MVGPSARIYVCYGFFFTRRLIGIVSECDGLRPTEKLGDNGELLTVSTVYLDFEMDLRLAVYGWGGSGGETLAQLRSGMVVEFTNVFVHSQNNDEKRKKGDFEFTTFFTQKRGSSMHVMQWDGRFFWFCQFPFDSPSLGFPSPL